MRVTEGFYTQTDTGPEKLQSADYLISEGQTERANRTNWIETVQTLGYHIREHDDSRRHPYVYATDKDGHYAVYMG